MGFERVPDPEYSRRWLLEVFAKCVRDGNGCLRWQNTKTKGGYAKTKYRGRTVCAHRKILELLSGVSFGRFELACHSCDVRDCCEPSHLWKGTVRENALDMIKKGRGSGQKVTHCPYGHEYSVKNTRFHRNMHGGWGRECRKCDVIRQRHRREQRFTFTNPDRSVN